MKKVIQTCIYLFFVSSQLAAQDQILNKLIASPQAASLDKFNDVPIDLYTGVPNISIPLYTIQDYDLEIPITLNYHASGIQVQEFSAWTGMNWSLVSGGLITRQVRDLDDFGWGGYYFSWNKIPLATNLDNSCTDQSGKFYRDEIYRIETGFLDAEADIYHVNLYNHQGSFTFSEGEIINLKNDNVKYEVVENDLLIQGYPEFRVTLPDGTIYFLGGVEAIEEHQQPNPIYKADVPYAGGTQFISYNNDFTYPLSFYLTKIVTLSGQEVNYEYTTSDRIIYDRGQHLTNINYDYTGNGTCTDSNALWDNIQYHHALYPSKITWNGGTLEMISDFNRCDSPGEKRLNGLQIKNANGQIVKEFEFQYSYDNDSNISTVCDENSNRSAERLWLTSLEQIAIDAPSEITSFEYYGGNLPDQSNRDRVDHWGFLGRKNSDYVNGVFQNLSDLEKRTTDTLHASVGSLKQISYPSGLNREFIYESNDYFDSNYFVYEGLETYRLCTDFYCPNVIYENEFTITEEVEASFFMEYISSGGDNWITVRLDKDGEYFREITIDNNEGANADPVPDKILFPPGNYTMHAYNFSIQIDNDYSRDDFNVYVYVPTNPILQKGRKSAGIRIKEIFSKENNIILSKVKYTYENDDGNSSGKLLNVPVYTKTGADPDVYWRTEGLGSSPGEWWADECYGTKTTDYNLAQFTGNNIGYSKVTVENYDGDNGKEEHYFYNEKKLGNGITSQYLNAPFFAPSTKSNKNGKLLKKVIYKTKSSGYEKVRETNYTYDFKSESYPNGLLTLGTFNLELLDEGKLCGGNSTYQLADYRTVTSFPLLQEVLELNYLDTNVITNKTVYEYNSNKHFLPTAKFYYLDQGKIQTEITKYSFDFAMDEYPLSFSTNIKSGIYNEMNEKNILSPVLVSSLVNNQLLSQKITEHYYENDEKFLIKRIFDKKYQGDYQYTEILDPFTTLLDFSEEVEYSYENGKIVEIERMDKVVETYIWNSLNEVIVKLVNVTFMDVKTYLGSDYNILIDARSNATTVKNIKNNLRNHFSNAMITTYTYEPLVGVKTITDPRGYTMTYHYDAFNRLKFVKDQNDNIVSENKYNYKN